MAPPAELLVKKNFLPSSQDNVKVRQAPIFGGFGSIYPGPHQGSDGKIDPRTWFSIPIELDIDEGTITYLIFPHNGNQEEVKEITISASGSWID